MHTVLETAIYENSAEAIGLSEDDRLAIKVWIAQNPQAGAIMKGTGGARKVRFAGQVKGKSGGYRVVTYYAAEDVPVFLLDIYSKGEKDNLSKAERNELKKALSTVADDYRKAVAERVVELRRG